MVELLALRDGDAGVGFAVEDEDRGVAIGERSGRESGGRRRPCSAGAGPCSFAEKLGEMSVVVAMLKRSVTPAPSMAALKRSVWVTAQEVMKPPKLQPPMARRLGSLMPWAMR